MQLNIKNTILTFFKLIFISFTTFYSKTVVEVLIGWLHILPINRTHVRAHVWGKFDMSTGYIFMDLYIHFGIYILVSIVIYNILKINIKLWIVGVFLSLATFLIILMMHNYQFPYNYRSPMEYSLSNFNFELIEQYLVYTFGVFTMIYLTKKKSLNSKLWRYFNKKNLNTYFYISSILSLFIYSLPVKYKIGVYTPSYLGWFWGLVLLPMSLISFIWVTILDITNKEYKSLIKRVIFFILLILHYAFLFQFHNYRLNHFGDRVFYF